MALSTNAEFNVGDPKKLLHQLCWPILITKDTGFEALFYPSVSNTMCKILIDLTISLDYTSKDT